MDTAVQYLIREELLKSKEIFNNTGSAALLMNLNKILKKEDTKANS